MVGFRVRAARALSTAATPDHGEQAHTAGVSVCIVQDPQDAGPGYRNVVGFPGGVNSPLFPIFAAANVNGMKLLEGRGNDNGRNAKEVR